ncbi:MAG: class I SAM-dependent methyltransferase [Burkholderiaceae bacterium]
MDFPDAARKWNERYARSEGLLFGEQPNTWLLHQAHWLKANSQLCCLADGEGRNSVWLAAQGHAVSAFDLSEVAVERTQKIAASKQVDIDVKVASLEQWIEACGDSRHHATLDAVIAVYIQFAGPALRAALFTAIDDVLKPGGVLIIEGYGQRQLQLRSGGPGVLENLYSPTLLPASFAGWVTLASRDAEVTLSEGSAHVGPSHVISAVLRKPVPAA